MKKKRTDLPLTNQIQPNIVDHTDDPVTTRHLDIPEDHDVDSKSHVIEHPQIFDPKLRDRIKKDKNTKIRGY